jgi:hypothetical protein
MMDQLVQEVIRCDLTLKVAFDEAELLIFPSNLLAENYKSKKFSPNRVYFFPNINKCVYVHLIFFINQTSFFYFGIQDNHTERLPHSGRIYIEPGVS